MTVLIVVTWLAVPFAVVVYKAYLEACILKRLISPWRSKHFDGNQCEWKDWMKRKDEPDFRAGVVETTFPEWARSRLWFVGGNQYYAPNKPHKSNYVTTKRRLNALTDLTLFCTAATVSALFDKWIGVGSPWMWCAAVYLFLPYVKNKSYQFWYYYWLDRPQMSFKLWMRGFLLNKAAYLDDDRVVVP